MNTGSTVQRLGLVFESRADAETTGLPLEQLYHWREPEELDAIASGFEDLGYRVVPLGSPHTLLDRLDEVRQACDFIVNLSVGFVGRTRLARGPVLYEAAGLPYWGADGYTKMVSQHKHLTKALLDHLGLPTPPWRFVPRSMPDPDLSDLGFPLMVKPAFEGSSIGIGPDARVDSPAALTERLGHLHHQLGLDALVERFVVGRELKVGMVGDRQIRFTGVMEDTADDGPMGERFLFFEAKKAGRFGKVPRHADAPEFAALLADCRRWFAMFLPLDYATFDVRVDEAGRHWFLECNADATLHPRRTLAQCAALNGLDFTGLLAAILDSALTRQGLVGVHRAR